MSRSLKERLDRLERRHVDRPIPRVVLALTWTDDAHVIGFEGNGVVVLRGDNEPLADCQARAFQLSGAVTLTTLYSAEGHRAAAEREEELSRRPIAPEVLDALHGPEIESPDPFALAGIGRKATREELWHTGALRGPSERLR